MLELEAAAVSLQAVEGPHAVHHPAADGCGGQWVKHAAQSTGAGRGANHAPGSVPADEKCHKSPNSDVAVGVGWPCGLRDADSKSCIADTCMGHTHDRWISGEMS